MEATSQNPTYERIEKEDESNRVVISGMSGLFPNCRNVKDLADVLYNKKNPISTNPRWNYNHSEVPRHVGKVPNLPYFDAQFFKVHYWQAHTMDTMARKILEQAYQAIYDAGMSPEHLSGKKVGVYIGTCFSESEKSNFYISSSKSGLGIAGCNKAMFANRISYWLNAKGPSMSIDEACCSSIAALEQAYLALSRDDCEAAIVGGGYVCLHPQSSVHYGRIIPMSVDGKTKSFDKNATGCSRSEAINVLFLQKAQDALRIYAELILVKNEFIYLRQEKAGPCYGFYRDPVHMAKFLNDFYKLARVPPQAVEYVEAFGSAVPEADKAELETFDEVFCKNRSNELLVGSVMSNIGYGEAASGISAVIKVLLGYHLGSLAGNLNVDTPRGDISAIRDGRIRILTENEPFATNYTAVNALSITGMNAHVLLHGYNKPKDLSRYKSNIPYLVTISARQDVSVQFILQYLKSHPIDPEEIGLLHNIHSTSISGHLGRGFTILDINQEEQTVSLCEKSNYFDNAQKPLWFVYSGMGSQWVGMGTQLMRIPIFAAAIERCHRVLQPRGVDVIKIITSNDKNTFDNILNSFVGIAAIQIGLTDVLLQLGLQPDYIIGHSAGELGCAYADGCFTAEEMILAAYYRGLVSVQIPFIRGSMAAVGIGYKQVIGICPPEIVVACHNGPDSSTISGPADIMKTFIAELTAKGIFAKEVPCSNIAYHSKYIAEAGPELLKHLRQVIKTPKLRSKRWLSTSVPQERWDEPIAKYSSAEYHTNNLLNAVLFEETSRLIPANAVTVEVAPHGLMQAILKRSLPESCHHVPITRRGIPNNVQFLLEAIGKLYMEGYNINVQTLYPKIEYPVSTGTPFLSPLVEWAHNEKWHIPLYMSAHRKTGSTCKFVYSIHDSENRFLAGHVIKGKNAFPFAAALVAVWDVLAMSMEVPKKTLSVEFDDVKLYSQPILHDQRLLRLFVSLHRGTGYFEIMDENTKVAIGRITEKNINTTLPTLKFTSYEELDLNSKDTYHLLSKRGYNYRDQFRSIHSANKSLTRAQILWRNNWVTIIDGMLQLGTLRNPHDAISSPIFIRKIVIDVDEHAKAEGMSVGKENVINAHVNCMSDLIRCGGIAIEDVKFREIPKLNTMSDLMAYEFIPFFQQCKSDVSTVLLVYLQILAENLNTTVINILEVSDIENKESDLTSIIKRFVKIFPTDIQHKVIHRDQFIKDKAYYTENTDVLLVTNLSMDMEICQTLNLVLRDGTFIINKELYVTDLLSKKISNFYHVLSAQYIRGQSFELARWRSESAPISTTALSVRSPSDLALLSSTLATIPQRQMCIIITSYPYINGFKALVQKWRKNRKLIQVVASNHQIFEDQNMEQLPNNDLVFNVLKDKHWGGWFYVPLKQKHYKTSDISLQCSRVGDFSSLHWVEMPKITGLGVEVAVHYAGINNIDVKRAAGIIPRQNGGDNFGMDFSGITKCGTRVMGLIMGGALSSRVYAHPELLWPIPEYWSLEDAATVPLAYCMAYYCLCIKYKLTPDLSVLVHGGAGALGQAVISIALGIGCTVFTTVSDMSKKRFIRKLFPQIKDEHIGQSRDESFGDKVLTRTNGTGCNLVISCVPDNLINVSFKCTAPFGITFDLIHKATRDNYSFEMFNLNDDKTYSVVDFQKYLKDRNVDKIKKLQVLVSEGIKRGFVRPLSRIIYTTRDTQRAFGLLAASNHRGRALLQLRVSAENKLVLQPEPRLDYSSDSTHLILCNNDYFGILIAERLVKRGVRNLHMHGFRKTCLDWSLEKQDINVKICNHPLDCKEDVKKLIYDCDNIDKIEGVYVVMTKSQSSTRSSVIQELDLITRKSCPNLKYFGIVCDTINNGFDTTIARAQDNLPVTLIKLPAKNVAEYHDTDEESIFNEDSVNSVEYALSTKEPILIALNQLNKSPMLLHDIAHLADINIPVNIEEKLTLADLNVGPSQAQIICTYLRDYYNLSLLDKDIPALTLKRIREIDQNLTDSGFKETKGLATFYTYIDPDELLATTEMTFLPTVVTNSNMRDDEFDVTQKYLCIIPGLEGHYERFRTLCERLKISAIILQPGLERHDESVSNLAKRFAELLLRKTKLDENFYLLGYESGALVALEMAAILEDHGLTGTVFLIGDSPERFHETLKRALERFKTDEELQIGIAVHMCNLMVGDHTDRLEDELCVTPTWAEKLEISVRSVLGRVPHSAQYARETIHCAYGRIKQIQAYRPTPRPLRSKLILIKAASSSESSDHSIQCYSQHPVSVYQLRAPLAHSAADLRCSAIINNHLDSELLEAFEKKNLCDAYLINANTFMTLDPAYDSIENS